MSATIYHVLIERDDVPHCNLMTWEVYSSVGEGDDIEWTTHDCGCVDIVLSGGTTEARKRCANQAMDWLLSHGIQPLDARWRGEMP